jgi:hypothetical protein
MIFSIACHYRINTEGLMNPQSVVIRLHLQQTKCSRTFHQTGLTIIFFKKSKYAFELSNSQYSSSCAMQRPRQHGHRKVFTLFRQVWKTPHTSRLVEQDNRHSYATPTRASSSSVRPERACY